MVVKRDRRLDAPGEGDIPALQALEQELRGVARGKRQVGVQDLVRRTL
jgi:hypothetical protein